MVEIGLVMDLDLIGLPFPVLIWGPFEVAEGAQVWLIVFSINYFAPSQIIGLAKKWRSFLWLLSLIYIEWGSSRMRGYSQPMWFLTCTRRRSLQKFCQELWTLSLVSFSGSNLTCTNLCVGLVYPSWWPFHSVCSVYGQTYHLRWLHLKRQVWLIQEYCVHWHDDFPI